MRFRCAARRGGRVRLRLQRFTGKCKFTFPCGTANRRGLKNSRASVRTHSGLSIIRFRQPASPGDADVVRVLRDHEVGGQRFTDEVGHGHLWVTVLQRASDFAHWVPSEHVHQDCARSLAAPRPTNQHALASRREHEQRHQQIARVTLRGRQVQHAACVTDAVAGTAVRLVSDVVMQADDCLVDDQSLATSG